MFGTIKDAALSGISALREDKCISKTASFFLGEAERVAAPVSQFLVSISQINSSSLDVLKFLLVKFPLRIASPLVKKFPETKAVFNILEYFANTDLVGGCRQR